MGEARRFSRLPPPLWRVRRRARQTRPIRAGAQVIRFILLTLAVLAWAFWILSGGSDFEPEAPAPRPVAMAEPSPEPSPAPAPDPSPAPAPEPARTPQPERPASENETPEPATIAASQVQPPAPQPEPATPADPSEPASDPVSDALTEALAAPEPAPAPAPEPARPILDLRMVEATRVNMRSGPSTDFRVVDTLRQGTSVEVKEIDSSGEEPWARIVVLASGVEGWMAERFLAAQ